MADKETSKPSFSAGMRWGKRFNVGFGICLVFTILVMVNYLSSRYFIRKELGLSTQNSLSPQTEKLLKALTNDVEITILFDTKGEEDIYGLTSKMLKEYSYRSPKILLKTIDFTRNPSAAQLLLAKHKMTGLQKNVILFHCNGTTKVVYGSSLSEYDIQPLLNQTSKEIRRQGFKGESLFTSAILAVAYPQKLKAYFTVGHGEHDPELTTTDRRAFSKFASILKEENNIQFAKLYLPGTNAVPDDCNLLIVAGPSTAAFSEPELAKIASYLKSGGRGLFLFNTETKMQSGIEEKILAKWGVGIRFNLVVDSENPSSFPVQRLDANHPITKNILSEQMSIELYPSRAVGQLAGAPKGPTAPKVEVLAQTGNSATSFDAETKSAAKGVYPLMVAVEQGSIKGVTTGARMVVTGDSFFLSNMMIDNEANRYFASMVVNWLADRPQILFEIGPKTIHEFKISLSVSKLRQLQLLFLVVMPGSVLFFGVLVWLKRRS